MDLIITKPIMVRDLICELKNNFEQDDIVTTGLWIKKKQIKTIVI